MSVTEEKDTAVHKNALRSATSAVRASAQCVEGITLNMIVPGLGLPTVIN